MHYMNSLQDGLIVAFPQNLLKEVKSTLNGGICFYFVHVLKEDISHLPSTASYRASWCLASLHSPSTCLKRLRKIQPGQEMPMKMLLQAHTYQLQVIRVMSCPQCTNTFYYMKKG